MKSGYLGRVLLTVVMTTLVFVAQAKETYKKVSSPIAGVGRIEHVFVIVLENHSRDGVIDKTMTEFSAPCEGVKKRSTPCITALAHQFASATKYYGVTHPSLPNYVALISGSNWYINSDNLKSLPIPLKHTNLVDQLEAAHKSWAGYMEALPVANKLADFWPSHEAPLYASKHNPFVLFENIRNNASRLAHVKPYTELAKDLARRKTTPNFALIVPDQCNDMHGGVKNEIAGHAETRGCWYGQENSLKRNADKFVHRTVNLIMASQAWKHTKSVIFIIADEGDYNGKATRNGRWDSPAGCCDSPIVAKGAPDIDATWPGGMYGGGLVPAIVIVSRGGKQGNYQSTTAYNHYSLLATIETIWHLGLLGNASDTEQVKPMLEFLKK